MAPTLGSSVLFIPSENDTDCLTNNSPVGEPRAAVVTHDWEGGCFNLTVFPDHGPPVYKGSVPKQEGDGTYSWKEMPKE